MNALARGAAAALLSVASAQAVHALDWSDSELHLQFANLDLTAYIDDNGGAASGGAPRETDSYMVDFSFARPFRIGDHRFSLEGHIEYIGGRRNEFDGRVHGWLLAQPQFRWNVTDRLSLGFEYQYWRNKLGDGATDENTVQALVVWQF